MSKILHVVGNRPQFIKLAPLYRELAKCHYEQYIIHSGQHYDKNLSEVFFRELEIDEPYVNLQVGSGSHAEMTAKAMLGLEREIRLLSPTIVILYGDTDTTVAGALVAAKLNLPIAHVEGGIRTGNKSNPEECNRVVTDHLSRIIFCPDNKSLQDANHEGLGAISYCTGDIMYDTFLSIVKENLSVGKEDIILMTWHRQENTDRKERVQSILDFIKDIGEKIICPLHPRTVKCLKDYGLWEEALEIPNFEIIEPVGYLEMVLLMQRAKLIVTDSGGLSKESSFAGAKCLFFSDLDIWHDLQRIEWLIKVNPEKKESIVEALHFVRTAKKISKEERPRFYGDGQAARKMVELLEKELLINGIKS